LMGRYPKGSKVVDGVCYLPDGSVHAPKGGREYTALKNTVGMVLAYLRENVPKTMFFKTAEIGKALDLSPKKVGGALRAISEECGEFDLEAASENRNNGGRTWKITLRKSNAPELVTCSSPVETLPGPSSLPVENGREGCPECEENHICATGTPSVEKDRPCEACEKQLGSCSHCTSAKFPAKYEHPQESIGYRVDPRFRGLCWINNVLHLDGEPVPKLRRDDPDAGIESAYSLEERLALQEKEIGSLWERVDALERLAEKDAAQAVTEIDSLKGLMRNLEEKFAIPSPQPATDIQREILSTLKMMQSELHALNRQPKEKAPVRLGVPG